MASAGFEQLFLQHVAASFDRQNQLADFLGKDYNWNLNINDNKFILKTSRRKYTFPPQILGSEAEEDGTWLWAWANAASNLPPLIVKAAQQLQALGEQQNIPELTEPELELSAEINGATLSMVAAGILSAGFYYRGPYEGGAVFLLIPDRAALTRVIGNTEVDPLFRIVTIFPRLIAGMSISNHREAFRHYLAYYNLTVTEQGDEVTGTDANGEVIKAIFDNYNRLTQLNTVVMR